jgi:hypothetical protein
MRGLWILGLLLAGGLAAADPAVVNHVEGSAAASAHGDEEWTEVAPLRKLRAGDRVWTDRSSRLELQAGRHQLRLDALCQLSMDELAPGATRMSLRRGSLIAQVAMLGPMENFEIGTPNLALRATARGRMRVDVDADRGVTQVALFEGAARVFGEDGKPRELQPGERIAFAGRKLGRADLVRREPADAFDQWALGRDRAAVASAMSAPAAAPDTAPLARAEKPAAASAEAPVRSARAPAKRPPRPQAQAHTQPRPATGQAWTQQRMDAWQREQEDWLRYQHGLPPAYPTRERGIPARRVG